MKEKNKKKLMKVISIGGRMALSKALADKIIDVPERPGIKDDLKEAMLKAALTLVMSFIASVIVRDFSR